MATTVSAIQPSTVENVTVKETSVPWYVWCSVLAVTSALIGLHWDISWHMSIGRDTFWTPAHVAIYMCGVLSGIACGYMILSTTFNKTRRQSHESVKILGLHGPFGAFIAAWGGAAMLTSAPFDNWWHNAYGLDVKIISPPHILLVAGIFSVQLGALILVLGKMNRAEGRVRERLETLFLYVGSAILILLMSFIFEYTNRVIMHTSLFYRVVALAAPITLVAMATASRRRWAATIVAGSYTAFWIAMLWILPFHPAEPKLGPVYQKVTHLIPMGFPLLLIVPAVLIDLLRRKTGTWSKWLQAAIYGSVFIISLLAVQWPFAEFLISPGARNWIFGSHYFAYFEPPDDVEVLGKFVVLDQSAIQFWKGMAIAGLSAIIMSRIGIAFGEWMKKIRR